MFNLVEPMTIITDGIVAGVVSSPYDQDERYGPTSSFKDRQAAVAVAAMNEGNIREAVIASTGNAAVAYAAACARAGIKLWVFMTSLVPQEKLREAALFGAEVIRVSGNYDQTKQIAAQFAHRRHLLLDRGASSIPARESMKTIAYEIVEQLGWRAPDWYIQAVSGGLGPLGVHQGFKELYSMGLIDRIPKLAVIQTEGCSPMVTAFKNGKDIAEPIIPDTRIIILSTGDPGKTYTYLWNITQQYGGIMESVTDAEAFSAMRTLAKAEGMAVEPATAVAFAGLEKMLKAGTISPEQKERLTFIAQGKHRLVYVAPERLRSVTFLQSLLPGDGSETRHKLSLLAVDEAHCISEWGHDFRPDYLHIAEARRKLGNPLTVALTAAATPKVQGDIVRLLGLPESTKRIVTGFNRPNLTLEVKYAADTESKFRALDELLSPRRSDWQSDLSNSAALIYTGTRRDAEEVAEFVRVICKLKAEHYHAGLLAEVIWWRDNAHRIPWIPPAGDGTRYDRMMEFIDPSAPKTKDYIREVRNENQKERVAPYRPSIDPHLAKLFTTAIPNEREQTSAMLVDWSFLDKDDGQPGESADWVEKQIRMFESEGDENSREMMDELRRRHRWTRSIPPPSTPKRYDPNEPPFDPRDILGKP